MRRASRSSTFALFLRSVDKPRMPKMRQSHDSYQTEWRERPLHGRTHALFPATHCGSGRGPNDDRIASGTVYAGKDKLDASRRLQVSPSLDNFLGTELLDLLLRIEDSQPHLRAGWSVLCGANVCPHLPGWPAL